MAYPLYQVDAFAEAVFQGNPAAVMPLHEALPDEVMLKLAQENNLSETAFVWPQGGDAWRIRWFTPAREEALCGHATLASAHVLWNELNLASSTLRFQSLSGELVVRRVDDLIELDFPGWMPEPATLAEDVALRLGVRPEAVYSANKELVVLACEAEVAAFDRDFEDCASLESGVILTALSDRPGVDFVSRCFGGPKVGIKEDPVTGSAHSLLAPYWGQRLNKTRMTGLQISHRPGRIECELDGDRVRMRGRARTYLRGFVEWTS